MDPASFAFAVLGTAEICLKIGQKLRSIYETYHDARTLLNGQIVLVDHGMMKVSYQIGILEQIWDSLDSQMQRLQNLVLYEYHSVLQKALLKLSEFSIRQESKIKKLKYSVVASHLRELLDELEKWERRFDPTWYLIARSSVAVLDHSLIQMPPRNEPAIQNVIKNMSWLRSLHAPGTSQSSVHVNSVFIPSSRIPESRIMIPMSSIVSTGSSNDTLEFLIDSRACAPGQTVSELQSDVRDLARSFHDADPSDLGMLRCEGVVKVTTVASALQKFELVFEVPRNLTHPKSLRQCLEQATFHALDDRIRLARLLARSVSSIHTAQFVHKNIAPESVVILQEKNTSSLGVPFLLGFDMFRHAQGQTYYGGDTLWEKNLYRHPTRQGNGLEQTYAMQHDIYSLGVCLLEIGLWTSFVHWTEEHDEPEPGNMIKVIDILSIKNRRSRATTTKDALVVMAEQELPSRIGRKYTEVVLACLTCLDADSNHFGNVEEFQDADGILVGVRYIEKILLQLEAISL